MNIKESVKETLNRELSKMLFEDVSAELVDITLEAALKEEFGREFKVISKRDGNTLTGEVFYKLNEGIPVFQKLEFSVLKTSMHIEE